MSMMIGSINAWIKTTITCQIVLSDAEIVKISGIHSFENWCIYSCPLCGILGFSDGNLCIRLLSTL